MDIMWTCPFCPGFTSKHVSCCSCDIKCFTTAVSFDHGHHLWTMSRNQRYSVSLACLQVFLLSLVFTSDRRASTNRRVLVLYCKQSNPVIKQAQFATCSCTCPCMVVKTRIYNTKMPSLPYFPSSFSLPT